MIALLVILAICIPACVHVPKPNPSGWHHTDPLLAERPVDLELPPASASMAPQWSSRGKYLAFEVYREVLSVDSERNDKARGEFQIWIVSAIDGARPIATFCTLGVADCFEPAWSPDELWISFIKIPRMPGARPEIWKGNVLTGAEQLVSRCRSDIDHQTQGPDYGDLSFQRVAWSRDGSGILFLSNGTIWIAPSRGGVPYPFMSIPNFRQVEYGSVSLSPDGQSLAISGYGHGLLIKMGLAELQFVSTDAPAYDPSWSPEGKYVLFAQENGSRIDGLRGRSIYALEAATSRIRRITYSSTAFDGQPTWRPSGDQVFFRRADLAEVTEEWNDSANQESEEGDSLGHIATSLNRLVLIHNRHARLWWVRAPGE